jgi:putative transposase
VGIFPFPDRAAIVRLSGAVLVEQNDEWTEQRRYMGMEILAAYQKIGQETDTNDADVTIEAIGA